MIFRILLPDCDNDSDDSLDALEYIFLEPLEVEGSDLAALTTHLRSHSCMQKRGGVESYPVGITAVNHQDEPTMDWNSREAHEFCQALNDEVTSVFLYDSVLDSMASPHDDISTPAPLPSLHEIAFSGDLKLHVSNVLRASDWTAYTSYLQNVFVGESCLITVTLDLEESDVVVDLQQQEFQLFIKAISSIRTRRLRISAKKFPASSFLSNLLFTPNLTSPKPYLIFLNESGQMEITINCSDPDWLGLAAFLQFRLLGRSWQKCFLNIVPSKGEQVNPTHYPTFLKNLCALQMERVAIRTPSSSLLLVPMLLKSFQSTGKELQKLHVYTYDCDWMNHDQVVEALQGKTRILENHYIWESLSTRNSQQVGSCAQSKSYHNIIKLAKHERLDTNTQDVSQIEQGW